MRQDPDDGRKRAAVAVALTVLYAAGLGLLFAGKAEAGLLCWAVSTVGGIAVLFLRRRHETTEEEGNDRCE